MTNLKKALQTNEAKGKGVTVSPSYAMKQLMIKMLLVITIFGV